MPANWNGTSFWTAFFGLVAALVTLVAAMVGILGTSEGGTSAGRDAAEPISPAATAAATTPPIATATATPIPTATPTPIPSSIDEVWREGTLQIPLSTEDTGQAADLDGGRLLRLGTSELAVDADIAAKDTSDDVALEPGVPQTDGVTFEARFVLTSDTSFDRNQCAAAATGSGASDHLLRLSDIDVGTHVCMVTTQGRLAEFEILDTKLNGQQRWVEIRYTTWANQ
jgi:hypothetical protein